MKKDQANGLVVRIFSRMPNVKVPQKKFQMQLFTALMSFTGKANFRNLSRYSEPCERTYARWFRREFPFTEFNRILMDEELRSDTPKIAAADASFMSKAGKHTEHQSSRC